MEDPDDLRIRQFATAINAQAGWVDTWQGIGGFYAVNLAGAALLVFTPVAGAALNESLLGPAEGRIFYESYPKVVEELARLSVSGSGRIITATPLGAWLVSTIGFGERIS